ncbi:MAG: hypothetical protein R8G34_15525 [Paracoccaceae bacterium]|nr:hypothetical protein [Paracoccaceae bacterium]
MSSDMAFLKSHVKEKDLYRACIAGWTTAGVLTGAFGGVSIPVTAAAGFAWGLLTCGPMSRMAAEKFLNQRAQLSEAELSILANELSRITGETDPDTLLSVLLQTRDAYRASNGMAS